MSNTITINDNTITIKDNRETNDKYYEAIEKINEMHKELFEIYRRKYDVDSIILKIGKGETFTLSKEDNEKINDIDEKLYNFKEDMGKDIRREIINRGLIHTLLTQKKHLTETEYNSLPHKYKNFFCSKTVSGQKGMRQASTVYIKNENTKDEINKLLSRIWREDTYSNVEWLEKHKNTLQGGARKPQSRKSKGRKSRRNRKTRSRKSRKGRK